MGDDDQPCSYAGCDSPAMKTRHCHLDGGEYGYCNGHDPLESKFDHAFTQDPIYGPKR